MVIMTAKLYAIAGCCCHRTYDGWKTVYHDFHDNPNCEYIDTRFKEWAKKNLKEVLRGSNKEKSKGGIKC